MNINQIKRAIPQILKAGLVPCIVGNHGVGKSSSVHELAKARGGMIDVRLGLLEPGDLIGLGDLSGDTTRFKAPDWLPRKGSGILFLDEINRAPRSVLQAVFSLILDRKIHEYTLPDGWAVVAAMNPPSDDYVVTDLSDEALKSRFVFLKLDPTMQEFTQFHGEGSHVSAFVREHPGLLRKAKDFELFSTLSPCDRSWTFVQRLLNSGIDEDLRDEVIMGIIGTEAGSAFSAFLKSQDKAPSGEEILKGRKLKEVERAVSALRMDYVSAASGGLLGALKEHSEGLTAKEYKNAKAFLMLLPADSLYAFVKDMPVNKATASISTDGDLISKAVKIRA